MTSPKELSPAAASFDAALLDNRGAASHIWRIDTPTGEWVERMYPAPHHRGLHPGNVLPDEQTARDLITAYEAETDRARIMYDLHTPQTYSEPVERPEGWYIRSIVELVEGERFPLRYKWKNDAPSLRQAGRLAVSLANYYTDVLVHEQEVYLGDISEPTQYLATPEGQAIRVDTDPMLWPVKEYLYNDIRTLHGWAKELPEHHIPQSVVKHLDLLVPIQWW